MLEAGTTPGSASHSPEVVWGGSVSVIRRSNLPRRRLVGSNSANLAGGLEAKDESNGSWEEEAEEREGDVR
jgi:hypothetical protein